MDNNNFTALHTVPDYSEPLKSTKPGQANMIKIISVLDVPKAESCISVYIPVRKHGDTAGFYSGQGMLN